MLCFVFQSGTVSVLQVFGVYSTGEFEMGAVLVLYSQSLSSAYFILALLAFWIGNGWLFSGVKYQLQDDTRINSEQVLN